MAVQMFTANELREVTKLFDMTHELNPDDFEGFGLRNSRVYFAKLVKLMTESNLSKVAKFMVMVLATAIKSKARVIEVMTKFAEAPWYGSVLQFYQAKVVQYTVEETKDVIAIVHIPSSMPSITARIWCMITKPIHRTIDNFMSNLWAAQLDLCPALMDKQKAWEVTFWDKVVKKGSAKYNAGFQLEFWETKACDQYPLMTKKGHMFAKAGENYTEVELSAYLDSFGADAQML